MNDEPTIPSVELSDEATAPVVEPREEVSLPDNAFRELKEGETYIPVMRPERNYPEVTTYSVIMGFIMVIIFSAAAAYLGLKVGQVFEAAIPIAIIAAGVAGVTKRKNALGENVIIQSIGAASGLVVAGAIFTLPALFILQKRGYGDAVSVDFWQMFISSLLGGTLGLLMFIPFRKYFVKDMHGKFPFPEATATTQVLISGEKGGSQAKPLLIAGLVGGVYDFLLSTFHYWKEVVTTATLPALEQFTENTKMLFKINTSAAVLGLGYIIGLRYAFIICAGSAFIWWVIIPLMAELNPSMAVLPAEEIFTKAKFIGIGGIAMSGLIGIIKSWGVIRSAAGLAGKAFKGGGGENVERTQRDISMKVLVFALAAALLVTLVFFYVGVIHNFVQSLVAFAVVTVFAFLFTTVAANAIAVVGSNPVSGMTLMTLILSSGIFVAVGLSGTEGIVAAMVVGGVVCTALSMAGGMVTDMKVGYWLGSTPAKQQTWKYLGTIVSAATVGGVMFLLSETFDFNNPNEIAAPQANAMAGVIEPLMMGGQAPWIYYIVGAVMALLLDRLKVPALPFSLGMFIPLQLNTPLLVGGIISWFVTTRSKDEKVNHARNERGTLLASGFIAGGALMGVVSAIVMYFFKEPIESFMSTIALGDGMASLLSIVLYAGLIAYLIYATLKAKQEE